MNPQSSGYGGGGGSSATGNPTDPKPHPLQVLMTRLGVTSKMTPDEILKRGLAVSARIKLKQDNANANAAQDPILDNTYFYGAPFTNSSDNRAWGATSVIGGNGIVNGVGIGSGSGMGNAGGDATKGSTQWETSNVVQPGTLLQQQPQGNVPQKQPCPFFAQGYCRYGDFCRYDHGTAANTETPTPIAGAGANANANANANAHAPPPHGVQIQSYGQAQSLTGGNGMGHNFQGNVNGDACAICLEEPANVFRRYGILPGCEHVFCLPCIRAWRRANEHTPRGYVRYVTDCVTSIHCPLSVVH